MKTMRLLALFLVMAGPAWATNDEKPQPYTGPVRLLSDAELVCLMVSGATNDDQTNLDLCSMKHASEAQALTIASRVLLDCKGHESPSCWIRLDYIKRRWGY